MSKSNNDIHANQCNPNHDAYWQSRGEDCRSDDWEDRVSHEDHQPTQADRDNHSNQLNPNHPEFKR